MTTKAEKLASQALDAFLRNVEAGREGRSLTAQRASGIVLIDRRSLLIGERCARTGHTLRRGDRVHVDADGRAELMVADGEAEALPAIASFTEALLAASAVEVTPSTLGPDHPLTAAPLRPCRVCGHTFRVGDAVVTCPCRPRDPICALAIHQDPAQGLTCYDAWRKSPLVDYCLANSRPNK